jgi:hypothetical protein
MKTNKLPTDYELWGRQCGDGWSGLIGPLQDEVLRLGGNIRQIKEKFGGLRFHYQLPKKVSKVNRNALQKRVERAMEASLTICEKCGAPGSLVVHNGLYLTVCSSCLAKK